MAESSILIAYLPDEEGLAREIVNVLDGRFGDDVDVVAAPAVDGASHAASQDESPLERLSESLSRCAALVVICSPTSAVLPELNFHAAAAWAKGAAVVVICHSGVAPATLPHPMSALNAVAATDGGSLNAIVAAVAKRLEVDAPEVDGAAFAGRAEAFEDKYIAFQKYKQAFDTIRQISGQILDVLRSGREAIVPDIDAAMVNKLKPEVAFLQTQGVLKFSIESTSIGASGTMHRLKFVPLPKLQEVLASHQKRARTAPMPAQRPPN